MIAIGDRISEVHGIDVPESWETLTETACCYINYLQSKLAFEQNGHFNSIRYFPKFDSETMAHWDVACDRYSNSIKRVDAFLHSTEGSSLVNTISQILNSLLEK